MNSFLYIIYFIVLVALAVIIFLQKIKRNKIEKKFENLLKKDVSKSNTKSAESLLKEIILKKEKILEKLEKKKYRTVLIDDAIFAIGVIIICVSYVNGSYFGMAIGALVMFFSLYMFRGILHGEGFKVDLDAIKGFIPKKDSSDKDIKEEKEELDVVKSINNILLKEKELKRKETELRKNIEDLFYRAKQLDRREEKIVKKEEEIKKKVVKVGKKSAPDENVENLKKTLIIADNLLGKLPEKAVNEFMNSKNADVYRDVVKKVRFGK